MKNNMYKLFFKRIFDLLFALVLLPFLLISLIITAPIIFLYDRGSVFYVAKRRGKDGKVFGMLKLRTMRVNAEEIRNSDGSVYTGKNDPRVTPFGRVLRRLSVDELPGGEGNITLAEYSELIGLGWGSALYWNGEGELSDFIAAMSELLSALDIDLPKSLMFKKDTYLSSYDALLSESGIENVIQSGDDDMKIVESTEPLGVWHPGYIGWRWVGTSTRLKSTIISDGGYALFEIAFNNAEEYTHTSYFPIEGEVNDSNRTRVFQNMMTNFINSIEAGEIEVLNIEDTRAKVEAYYIARAEREAANEIRREQIKDEIQEIERQMTLLYDEYH